MKSSAIVKVNNQLKNRGVTFSKDAGLSDIIQSWSFLTRFVIDLIEDKSKEYAIVDATDEDMTKYKKHFTELLKEWIMILNEEEDNNS